MFPPILATSLPALATTIATTLAQAATAIGTFISTYGPTIARALPAVSSIIQSVASILNIIRPDEQLADIGDRALQAADADILPEQFDTYQQYMDEIRNFKLDPEKSDQYSLLDKELSGIALACKSMEQQLNLPPDTGGLLCTCIALAPAFFNTDRIQHWLHTGQDLAKIVQYFNNGLGATESYHTEESLIRSEQQLSPGSDAEIEQQLEQVKADLYQKQQD